MDGRRHEFETDAITVSRSRARGIGAAAGMPERDHVIVSHGVGLTAESRA